MHRLQMLHACKDQTGTGSLPHGDVVMFADDKDLSFKILELARMYGWNGDYHEVMNFVKWVFEQYGVELPPKDQLEPR